MIPNDPNPEAATGDDGLTDWERKALVDKYIADTEFTLADYMAAVRHRLSTSFSASNWSQERHDEAHKLVARHGTAWSIWDDALTQDETDFLNAAPERLADALGEIERLGRALSLMTQDRDYWREADLSKAGHAPTTATTIRDAEELERFEYNGGLDDWALVRDNYGRTWLGYNSEHDGGQCISPPDDEDEATFFGNQRWQASVKRPLRDLPLPMTITTEGD